MTRIAITGHRGLTAETPPWLPASNAAISTAVAVSSDEIRLAKVRLAQREPDESAAVGLRSLGLAADLRSSIAVTWLLRFDAELRVRYPRQRRIRHFHDHLLAYLEQVAPERNAACMPSAVRVPRPRRRAGRRPSG